MNVFSTKLDNNPQCTRDFQDLELYRYPETFLDHPCGAGRPVGVKGLMHLRFMVSNTGFKTVRKTRGRTLAPDGLEGSVIFLLPKEGGIFTLRKIHVLSFKNRYPFPFFRDQSHEKPILINARTHTTQNGNNITIKIPPQDLKKRRKPTPKR